MKKTFDLQTILRNNPKVDRKLLKKSILLSVELSDLRLGGLRAKSRVASPFERKRVAITRADHITLT